MEKTGTSETGPICDLLPLTFFLSPSQAFCVLYRHLMASPGANLVAFFFVSLGVAFLFFARR
jgi:hypothetical protein